MNVREYIKTALWTVIVILATAAIAHVERSLFTAPPASQHEAENAGLRRGIDSLKRVVEGLQTERGVQLAVIDSLQCRIEQNTVKIKQNTIKHEKNIVHIDAMPDDSLLYFFTEYLR